MTSQEIADIFGMSHCSVLYGEARAYEKVSIGDAGYITTAQMWRNVFVECEELLAPYQEGRDILVDHWLELSETLMTRDGIQVQDLIDILTKELLIKED